jgi:hypothetical protein
VPKAVKLVLYFLVGFYAVCVTWQIARRWYKHKLSSRWPMVPGKFEKGTVQKVTAFFDYRVNDAVYGGEYTEDFQALPHAQQLLRSLENGPLYGRYNPTKPWDQVLDP